MFKKKLNTTEKCVNTQKSFVKTFFLCIFAAGKCVNTQKSSVSVMQLNVDSL